jgi:tRNA(Ile)-lysidine synthase
MGIEQAARHLRYRALERLRRQTGADVILTAHHADDQAETVLLRAMRGSHRRGLSGILPVLRRPPVARPLLTVSREEIERYVRRRRLAFRDDASNDDLTFRRNLVRHRLLALVGRRLKIDATATLPRLAEAARSLGEAAEGILSRLEQQALRSERGVHVLHADEIGRWPDAVVAEMLTSLLRRASLPPTDARLRALRALLSLPVGRWRPMDRAWQAFRERDGLSLVRSQPLSKRAIAVSPGSSTAIAGGRLRISRPRSVPRSVKGPPSRAWVDVGALRGRLTTRIWKPADRIVPLGMTAARKVSDLLTDRKVPAWQKRRVPVVLSGGRIIWLCGVAVDNRVKVRPGTKQVLQFSYHSTV